MQEIERKFLVAAVPDELAGSRRRRMSQGYLASDDRGEVRLRSADGRCTLTVKSRGGLVRDEREVELTTEQFGRLWPATAGRRLEKSRFEIAVGSAVAELDVYEGALEGLATVEVEFASEEEAAAFRPPDWFGAEVTDDPRYRNRALAEADRPPAAGGGGT